ncbi:MAG: phosphoribosylanthranilate isomerase [Tannerellaceae bacterium]|jgi:phosphoribosylanthranilate isomerase|nr:phosphoribosylanthranilate isomerase [Tannerellaceae bacterium]
MIIKVCGMRHPDNIRRAASIDINWIGFIFYKKSPRFLSLESKEMDDRLPSINHQLKKVGVFVNASIDEMIETTLQYKLDYIQLHGNESPAVCHTLYKRGYSLIKAFSIATEKDLIQTKEYEDKVEHFLFDTKCEGYGGSGKRFDWTVLSSYTGKTPFLLSGGITPGSIEDIRQFQHPRLYGIDLNSGFEIEPGFKDIDKINDFVKEIRTINHLKK